MLITRMSPRGGRPLGISKFPLKEDKYGNFGLRLGYLEDGEPILIKLSDAEEFANNFGSEIIKHRRYINSLKQTEKVPWQMRVAKWLLKDRDYLRVVKHVEQEEND